MVNKFKLLLIAFLSSFTWAVDIGPARRVDDSLEGIFSHEIGLANNDVRAVIHQPPYRKPALNPHNIVKVYKDLLLGSAAKDYMSRLVLFNLVWRYVSGKDHPKLALDTPVEHLSLRHKETYKSYMEAKLNAFPYAAVACKMPMLMNELGVLNLRGVSDFKLKMWLRFMRTKRLFNMPMFLLLSEAVKNDEMLGVIAKTRAAWSNKLKVSKSEQNVLTLISINYALDEYFQRQMLIGWAMRAPKRSYVEEKPCGVELRSRTSQFDASFLYEFIKVGYFMLLGLDNELMEQMGADAYYAWLEKFEHLIEEPRGK